MSRLVEHLERVIRGKREALELVVCAVAAGGHVLASAACFPSFFSSS